MIWRVFGTRFVVVVLGFLSCFCFFNKFFRLGTKSIGLLNRTRGRRRRRNLPVEDFVCLFVFALLMSTYVSNRQVPSALHTNNSFSVLMMYAYTCVNIVYVFTCVNTV